MACKNTTVPPPFQVRAPSRTPKRAPNSVSLWKSGFGRRDDGHVALVAAATAEFHNAIREGVEGVVLADANVVAGVVLGATLANKNVACDADLAAINFDAQSFAFRFAAVLG